jgi:gluconolactonase
MQKAEQQPKITVLATGVGFCEGPVITRAGDVIVTSVDRGMLYKAKDGVATVFAQTRGGPNGAAEGVDGKIYVAQNSGNWRPGPFTPGMTGGVQVVSPDGTVEWLTQDLVYASDLCFGPDGYLYVTDPSRRPSRNDGRLWRVNVATGEADLMLSVPYFPNGINFGVEDDAIYVASTRDSKIVRYPLGDGKLGEPETAVQMTDGHPDGFAFDADGNIVIAAIALDGGKGSVQTWDPNGKLLDVFYPGSHSFYTNVALSEDGILIVTDADESGAVIEVSVWPAKGLALHPFRV